MFCIFLSNQVILAGTCDELSLGQAKFDRHTDTDTHTDTGDDNTHRPKGPRVKTETIKASELNTINILSHIISA